MVAGAFAVGAAVAVAAEAQERGERDRERDRDRGFAYVFGPDDVRIDMRRGRLGIVVTLAPDPARDSVGAHVEAVTPGGPADRAGVRSGDIITRMNGVRLGVTEPADLQDFESRPGRRLINLASRLDPGDTVRLEVRRDGRTQTLTFAAAERDMDVIVERLRVPGGLRRIAPRPPRPGEPPEPPGEVRIFAWGGAARDLELVRVGPELAQGLGIPEGLLVVDAGRDTALGLRAGDVITSIGGRRPTSPAQAMRILGTYEAEETVQFEVTRQRRRITVTGRMPQADQRWRIRRNSFEWRAPSMPHLEHMERMMEELMPRTRFERRRHIGAPGQPVVPQLHGAEVSM
jgi:hypothetical protein